MYITIIKVVDNNNKLIDAVTISENFKINASRGDILDYKLGNLIHLKGEVIEKQFNMDDDAEYFNKIDITETIVIKPLK